ncbi:hypothetical protein IMCC9480_2640 [Oxalobacteraceae bacterium IMCC9480]|nr:hypothetical protein IMCC9480_2640 [Oxalobacteraceae bacterium IMCC9480]
MQQQAVMLLEAVAQFKLGHDGQPAVAALAPRRTAPAAIAPQRAKTQKAAAGGDDWEEF